MKSIPPAGSLFAFPLLVLLAGHLVAAPLGSAFSYQGRLQASGSRANGCYDFQFSLWDAVSSGNLAGATQSVAGITVSNGLFAVQLDFGPGPFLGNACWLEVGVRTNGGDTFTTLSPRQPLLPVPYALMANSASNLLGTLPASQLSGPLPPDALADYSGTANITNPANSFAGSFTGDGSGLTNLPGGALQPGTVNSNALDAPTAARLALAGTGNGASWTNTAMLFVDVNGNDATAVKGALPWKTIQAALSNAMPGDVIRLGVGTWDVGTDLLDIPHDVSLVGAGPGLSVIHTAYDSGASGHCAMIPGNNSVIAGFTFAQDQPRTNFCYLFGAQNVDKSFTNVLVQNLLLDGETDGVYVQNDGLCTMTIRNSALQTKWDIMILSSSNPDSSFVVDNVQLTIDNRGGTNADLLEYEVGNFFGIGSRVSVYNCFGRMYIEDFNGGGGPAMRLVNAYPSSTNTFLTMANCAFDFTCPATLVEGFGNAYPTLGWPLDVQPDFDAGDLGFGMGILNPDNEVGNTNCSFMNVCCRYSNCFANYFVSQYITNYTRIDLPGSHLITAP